MSKLIPSLALIFSLSLSAQAGFGCPDAATQGSKCPSAQGSKCPSAQGSNCPSSASNCSGTKKPEGSGEKAFTFSSGKQNQNIQIKKPCPSACPSACPTKK